MDKAIFAGGCFWCVEALFDGIDGVTETIVGYTGGHTASPTYAKIAAGDTGHVEAIEVSFDPARVTYRTLLEAFWKNIDPMDKDGQFCDKGAQYQAAIFPLNPEQRLAAEESMGWAKGMLELQDVAVQIRDAGPFYPAEEEHQGFHQRQAARYKIYEFSCGRKQRLREVWEK